MEHQLNILSTPEEFAEVRHSITAFLDTYGDCEATLYEKGTVIEEDGLLISGEYGTLDTLFAPITDPRLKRSANFEEGRMWMEWNAVVYAIGE